MSDKDLAELPDGPEDDKEQTLVAHLVELRSRLVRHGDCYSACFRMSVALYEADFRLFEQTAHGRAASGRQTSGNGRYRSVHGAAEGHAFVAFVIALPYVLWQLWGFVAPGLYRKEKKLAAPIIISSLVMFFLGMAYCYFIVFRMVFQFIAGFSPNSVNFAPDIDSYFSFVLALFLAFGVTFEVPIVVVVLNRMGITSIDKLKKARPYMVVGAFVIAAIFTPPDVLSQMLLALPLVILYQVGIWLCAIFGKPKE